MDAPKARPQHDTKSGTNNYHGSAFGFPGTQFNAENFYEKQPGAKGSVQRQFFGGSVAARSPRTNSSFFAFEAA